VRNGRSRAPAATYRLQLRPDFGFEAAADQAGYLASLGVTHAYLSPILQAVPGSTHGYDVVDHSRISADRGGEAQFRAMAGRFADHGIGLVVDIVPNHMSVPDRAFLNRQLWLVLRDGQQARYAHWFDVDWAAAEGRMVLPYLPGPLRNYLDLFSVTTLGAATAHADEPLGELADEPVLRFGPRVLPLRPGTESLPVRDLLDAQAYRLDSWRAAAASLNWRRFLDIASLIAIRVEEPDVFAATHGLILGLIAEGLIAGLRVDHVDGLADPAGYLRQLATATGGCWVVAEKVLAAGEELPADWACAGTTGYDTLAAVGGLFTNPAGVAQLGWEYSGLAAPGEFAQAAWTARREMAGGELSAEVGRLARLAGRVAVPALTELGLDDRRFILAELLAAMGVYRAYATAGQQPSGTSIRQLDDAASLARRRIPRRLHDALDALVDLLPGPGGEAARDQLLTLFQQTCAAVQAKGVEDTAMYRWTRLLAANEVGSDPDRPGRDPSEFHAFAARLARDWPATMTTLSTHDTKRQEDVRARLAVLSESPDAWAREVSGWHLRAVRLAAGQLPEPATECLMWQTLVGAWPLRGDRLTGYLIKAMREAKTATSWLDQDLAYESSVTNLARSILADQELGDRIAAFVTWITPDANANSLGAKLVQLTMPGIPDVYQGCELAGYSLVDPDNRRPVDFARRRAMLAALESAPSGRAETDASAQPADSPGAAVARGSLDAGKLLICCRALALRRDHPHWFRAGYQPLTASGHAAQHALAFARAGRVITVATRLPAGLRRSGGWEDTALRLPAGQWRDVLTGAVHAGGDLPLASLTASLPVALLVRRDDGAGA
jgi:(1->4)-alpha-D-glucan 1-alpha-D-glucosylmutase